MNSTSNIEQETLEEIIKTFGIEKYHFEDGTFYWAVFKPMRNEIELDDLDFYYREFLKENKAKAQAQA